MAISRTELEQLLLRSFPYAKITITDLLGDQDHYALEIEDKVFLGHSLISQHKMVKNSLSVILNNNQLHAITIKTKTPGSSN